MSNTSIGSIWRKWDLQVQTYKDSRWTWPDNYPVEEEEKRKKFNTDLIKHCQDKNIAVIAITDHNSGEAIDDLITENESLNKPITVLPGVEVISCEGIHIVAIFNQKSSDNRWETWAETIRQFLTTIDMSQPTFLDEGGTPAVARKGALDIIQEIRKFDGIAIFAHARSTNGGLFCKSDSRTRKHLLKECNVLDAAAIIEDVPARISKLSEELNNHQFNAEDFAFINTSDSRRISDVGTKFTWIKANPTFEGLKQIIYEPKERVKIQTNSPFKDNKKIFFGSLNFIGSKHFVIPDSRIPLNREFVTVIGGRGSGKSALLESIAFLNEEHTKIDQNGKERIIEYYRKNIDNKEPAPGFTLSIKLVDKDGNDKEYTKSLENIENLDLPIFYIGQEQLGLLATNEKELTKKICDLINLDFDELKKTEIIEETRDLLTEIRNTKSELLDLYKNYPEYKNGNFDEWLKKYVSKKTEQIKSLSSQETKDLLGKINQITDRGIKLKDFYGALETLKQNLDNIEMNKQIDELNDTQRTLYPDRSSSIPAIDLTIQKEAIEKQLEDTKKEMNELRTSLVDKKKRLIRLGIKEDINMLFQSIQMIQREITNTEKIRDIHKRKKELLEDLIKKRNQLFIKIKDYLEENKRQIDEKFVEFKTSRDDSEEEERELFQSIIQDINVEGCITFNQDPFCHYLLENCVDERKIKTIEELKAEIAKRNENGSANEITLSSLKEWIENELDDFLGSDKLIKRGDDHLIEYLFTMWDAFLEVNTVVKLKGIPTQKLSIGQRGTLLLKIYLATATAKQIFIVDQPEDHLDNQFIAHELVPLIRKIKKLRQIILSTHNANLVVNADSEQIIVARLDSDSEKDYISGAIEDPFINRSIKEILEGGEEAFRKREDKYGMGRV